MSVWSNPIPGGHFQSYFWGSKDFLIIGGTDPIKPIFAGPLKLKKLHFSEFKIFENWHFLASNPLETINIDM